MSTELTYNKLTSDVAIDLIGRLGKKYVPTAKITAVEVPYPFTIETPEGELKCTGGYLTVDTAGVVRAMEREAFEATYKVANVRKPIALTEGRTIDIAKYASGT